jgi:hypothetical protein
MHTIEGYSFIREAQRLASHVTCGLWTFLQKRWLSWCNPMPFYFGPSSFSTPLPENEGRYTHTNATVEVCAAEPLIVQLCPK